MNLELSLKFLHFLRLSIHFCLLFLGILWNIYMERNKHIGLLHMAKSHPINHIYFISFLSNLYTALLVQSAFNNGCPSICVHMSVSIYIFNNVDIWKYLHMLIILVTCFRHRSD